jgi:ubiquinone biosynthesis protein UbiJ
MTESKKVVELLQKWGELALELQKVVSQVAELEKRVEKLERAK